MISYPRVNCLKTIPLTAAHTHMAHIRRVPPPPLGTAVCRPGVKCSLSVKWRLQTESKTQAGCKIQNKDCRLGVKYRPNTNCSRNGFKGKINPSNTCKRSLTCLLRAFTNPFLCSLEGHRWPENIIAVFNLFSVLETSRFNFRNQVFNTCDHE